MPIIVTHLSKYYDTQACLAGVDLETNAFVRVKDRFGGFPQRQDLVVDGRHIALGDVIEFRPTAVVAQPPHRENVGFIPGTVQVLEVASPYLPQVLDAVVSEDLWAAFGCAPHQSAPGNSCGFQAPDQSLAIIEPTSVDEIAVNPWGEAKIWWQTDGLSIRSCLDDVRFFIDHQHPDPDAVAAARVDAQEARCLLACSIAWRGDAYWLLVAGLHIVPN